VILAAWWADPLKSTHMGNLYTVDGQDPTKVTLEESRESLELGLKEIVHRLSEAGKEVYIVQDNPDFNFNPARLMMTRLIGPRRVLAYFVAPATTQRETEDFASAPSPPEDLYARQLIARVAADYPSIDLIDLRSNLCAGDNCRFAEGDGSFYMDHMHLSTLGASTALRGFEIPRRERCSITHSEQPDC
jgi:hypothetical protein